jgi:lysosomal alpha-mannosidase
MNDRSQGGSVIDESKIELMQNRRLFKDDARGVDEALNETDSFGNGITVHCVYHV